MPNQSVDLNSFLSEQGAAGQMDSQGDFTVSHNEAVRKLARFALPRPTAWVSKLVQSAVRWRCQTLRISQSLTETSFHFVMGDPGQVPNEQEILGALVSAGLTGPRAVDAFGLALRGMVEQSRLSFLLVCDSSEGDQHKRIYAGTHYGRMSEEERMAERFVSRGAIALTVCHLPGGAAWKAVAHKREALSIVGELRTYAYMSPVPIVLNGQPLEGPLNSSAVGYSKHHFPLVTSGLNGLSHSPPRLLLPPTYEEKFLSVRSHPRRILRSYAGHRSFAAAYLMTYRPSLGSNDSYRRSELLWLLDGVIVDQEEIGARDKLELRLYANAAGLNTDLTGFRLVDGAEYRQRRSEILSEMAATLDGPKFAKADFFYEDRDQLSAEDELHDRNEAAQKRLKVVTAGIGAGFLVFILTPIPLVGALLGLGSLAGSKIPGKIKRESSRLARAEHQEELYRKIRALGEILEKTVTLSKGRGWTKDQSGSTYPAVTEADE